MASSSTLTLYQTAFPSTRQPSPSLEFISMTPQHFRKLKPWQYKLAGNTKLPGMVTMDKRIARVRIKVSAGYKKSPMETPGAYELIDEESGERVIVWGGVDDGESSLPSKPVLSRNSKINERTSRTEESSGGKKTPSAVEHSAFATSTPQKMNRGFGRLKVQKIKSLVRKASQEKQETYEKKYKELDIDEIHDDDQTATSVSEGIFNKGNKNVTVKSGIEQLMDDQLHVKSPKFTAVPVVSASHPPEPRKSSRSELRDLNHVQKFSSGINFFSRNFFKDLPCSDFMIDSLRALGFVRPSHIQFR